VGISTAINWARRLGETGSVKPDKVGGYRPKKIVGPPVIGGCNGAGRRISPCAGLVAELPERGLKVDYRTVLEFVHAEKLSHKKRRCR
jgi:putative transposase